MDSLYVLGITLLSLISELTLKVRYTWLALIPGLESVCEVIWPVSGSTDLIRT
jgi:hypothetical protein